MGRQVAILLSFEDEAELLDLAHERGFLLTTGWLREPDLISQELRAIPPDETASDFDYDCYLVPRELARARRAKLANPELGRPYRIDNSELPCIEWIRTFYRRNPDFRYSSRLRTRLYVATDTDCGPDAKWMGEVIALYDLLVKRIKKQTVKIQDVWPRYVSKRFRSDFFEARGLVRSGNAWIMKE